MQSQHIAKLKRYIEVITRNKWLILGCFLLSLTCALIFFLKQEKVYQGEALLGFQQPHSDAFQLVSDNPVGIEEEVTRITQRALSQSNLEALIDEEALHTEHSQELSPVEFVEETRETIKIIPYLSENNIRIQCTGKDPAKVARVSNWLAGSFIEEDLQFQQEQASEISALAKEKLESIKDTLKIKEAELQDYKFRYFYAMPDKQELNKSRLTALRDKYKTNQESISLLKRNKEEVLDQISVRKQLLEEQQRQKRSSSAEEQQTGTSINIDQQAKLDMLKNGLMELQSMYSEQHPMVRRLNKQITEIQRLIDEGTQELNYPVSIKIELDTSEDTVL
ncbi:MAG: hypothetical protein KJO32_12585, partial [Deltaproteobacteria bacterium]|nr:hypothetical protein [Deltaproteobacteria bacterium]